MQLSKLGQIWQKVIWIDPLSGSKLPEALWGCDEVERIETVLLRGASEAELLRYSLSDLYSLKPPTAALTSLMPGLKQAGTIVVPATTPKALTKTLAKCEGPFQVLIDTPGEEQTVLNLLDRAGILERVTTLVLRCGVEPFFKKAPQIETLMAKLENKGFSLAALDEDEDPDWPLCVLKLDVRAQLIKSLEGTVTQTQADLAQVREEAEALRRQVGTLEAEFVAQSKALTEEGAAQTALKADLDTRTKERDAAKGAATQASEAQAALKTDLDTRTKERDAAKGAATQATEAQAALKAEIGRASCRERV